MSVSQFFMKVFRELPKEIHERLLWELWGILQDNLRYETRDYLQKANGISLLTGRPTFYDSTFLEYEISDFVYVLWILDNTFNYSVEKKKKITRNAIFITELMQFIIKNMDTLSIITVKNIVNDIKLFYSGCLEEYRYKTLALVSTNHIYPIIIKKIKSIQKRNIQKRISNNGKKLLSFIFTPVKT